jgi:hypothetical protein
VAWGRAGAPARGCARDRARPRRVAFPRDCPGTARHRGELHRPGRHRADAAESPSPTGLFDQPAARRGRGARAGRHGACPRDSNGWPTRRASSGTPRAECSGERQRAG